MERRVTRTGKDRDRDITALCGSWGRVSKETAIYQIDNRLRRYFVEDRFGRRANVIVVNGPRSRHLRTDPNSSCTDNLDSLPNC